MKNIFCIAFISLLLCVSCTRNTSEQKNSNSAQEKSAEVEKVEIKELAQGTGEAIQSGQTAKVHYTGWLFDSSKSDNKGSKFDSSLDRKEAFEFPVGQGVVIAGWDQGVLGMKVGEKRLLKVVPSLGYGEKGAGGIIPPNATLLFEVELLQIK